MATITEMLRERLAALRASQQLVPVKLLDPHKAVLEAIAASGGQLGAEGYDVWCHNDCCGHNSHDPGQNWQMVTVPQSWVDEAISVGNDVWDYNDLGDKHPVMVVPSTPPVLIIEAGQKHYAASTLLRRLRPEALALLEGKADG